MCIVLCEIFHEVVKCENRLCSGNEKKAIQNRYSIDFGTNFLNVKMLGFSLANVFLRLKMRLCKRNLASYTYF